MITIREAELQDAAAISRLMLPVAEAQIASEFPSEGRDELLGGMTPQAVARNLQQGYRYHLAFDDEGLCGIIGMRGYSHVYHLFVPEQRQGQGIAARLWRRAWQASWAEVRLAGYTVFSSRVAEGFYHRMGFRRTGDEMTRKGVTAIPMRLDADAIESG